MKRRRKKKRNKGLAFLGTMLLLSLVIGLVFTQMRPVVIRYAQSVAQRILLNAANEAVVSVLSELGINYDNVTQLSYDGDGHITTLQIDAVRVNLLKSRISLKITELVAQKETYTVSIPIGTFLGSEYTTGLGPKIRFSMQLSAFSVVDFQSTFEEAGLNQVTHRIVLQIESTGRLVMRGVSDVFSVQSSALVAETVLVGVTPDAYTKVIETPLSDSAGILQDYGAAAN